MPTRHTLSPSLDKRLVSYAAGSFNAYEAVYALQQFASLLPSFCSDLELMYGRAGLGDGRRLWGVVADLVSAIASVPPTMDTLIEFGFTKAVEVDHLIAHGGDFALSYSPVLRRLDFRAAILGDLSPIMMTAVEHDAAAKPLLDAFQAELQAYDSDAAQNVLSESDFRSFRDIVRVLGNLPESFPLWDGRPMFLDEQKALLDYLAKCAGTEIVADALVDEPLGEFLLRSSGIISKSDFNGDSVVDINQVPHSLLRKPVEYLCHQVGNSALNALKKVEAGTDVLDRLFVIEHAIKAELGIDVTPALQSTRTLLVEHAVRGFVTNVTDIRGISKERLRSALPFEFPNLADD